MVIDVASSAPNTVLRVTRRAEYLAWQTHPSNHAHQRAGIGDFREGTGTYVGDEADCGPVRHGERPKHCALVDADPQPGVPLPRPLRPHAVSKDLSSGERCSI